MSEEEKKKKSRYPEIDYKDPIMVSRFLLEGGKIRPSRLSKIPRKQQTLVARAIKKARTLALVPLGMEAYDSVAKRIEPISPKPFDL